MIKFTVYESLVASGFSREFCNLVDKKLKTGGDTGFGGELGSGGLSIQGFVVLLDEPNSLRFCTKDFVTNACDSATLHYSSRFCDPDDDDDEEKDREESPEVKETKEDNSHRKHISLGPGFHPHPTLPNFYLCCEATSPPSSLMHGSGVYKYHKKFALVAFEKNCIPAYLDRIAKTHESGATLKSWFYSDEGWIVHNMAKRDPSTIFLRKNQWEDLRDDARDFFDRTTRDFYSKHCIPYTRNYLFSGPPGTGKSSVIKTLASELDLELYILNLASSRLTDCDLQVLFHSLDTPCILALEDIDRVFDNFSVNQTNSQISFSHLLNLLDGLMSRKGLMVIMTCNDDQLMQDALGRYGRVDRKVKFDNADRHSMKNMFLSFYPESEEAAEKFSKTLSKSNVPVQVAALQEYFVRKRKRTAEEAGLKVDTGFFRKRVKTSTHQNMML